MTPSLGSAKLGALLVTAQVGAEFHERNDLSQRAVRSCLLGTQPSCYVCAVNKTVLDSQNGDTEHLPSPSLGFCLW